MEIACSKIKLNSTNTSFTARRAEFPKAKTVSFVLNHFTEAKVQSFAHTERSTIQNCESSRGCDVARRQHPCHSWNRARGIGFARGARFKRSAAENWKQCWCRQWLTANKVPRGTFDSGTLYSRCIRCCGRFCTALRELFNCAEHRSTSVRVVLISDMTKVMTLGRRFGCFFCGQVVFCLCRNFNDFTTCKIPRF